MKVRGITSPTKIIPRNIIPGARTMQKCLDAVKSWLVDNFKDLESHINFFLAWDF
jgi:hypothetical protein